MSDERNRLGLSRREALAGAEDTPNPQAIVFDAGGRRSMLRLSRSGGGYVGRLALGVRV